ncbi:aldo/keto reductase [Novosphingobium sp.]|uniref:aldo/keto reductase n=1 Tax=Novosphingobium sp. TaxID=1874826 RepID=UPI00286DBCEC|nr:aldo/keto reductase [Novosphingobium sp.]
MLDAQPGLGGIPLVLGGNPFGWTIDRDASFAVLDAFYEAGGRAIDTAEIYSAWVPGNKGGESETIIGEWMELRGVRADMRIATKTGLGGAPGALAPERVKAACEGSLERLRSDYIDLYYVHRDDQVTSPEDVAGVYAALLAAGKVRELGLSNTEPTRLAAFNAAAAAAGTPRFTVLQPGYNLVWRNEYPADLERLAVEQDIAVLPYYGLGAGFLTGKYASDADFTGMRGENARQFASAAGWQALPVLREVAAEAKATMGQVALVWLATRPGVWAPIASATSPAQVAELCVFTQVELTEEQLTRLDAVSIDGVGNLPG